MSEDFKLWLDYANSKYIEARTLIETTSLSDPPTRPYKSRYEASEIFQKLLDELNEQNYEDHIVDDDPINQVNLIKITLRYELGVVSVDTEETSMGQRFLESAKGLMDEIFRNCHNVVLLRSSVLNQLGFLMCSFGDYEKACQLLKDAENSITSWKAANKRKALPTYDFADSFRPSLPKATTVETMAKLDKAETQTLYFLAQVYEKLGRSAEAADYCNQTLRRQYAAGEHDPVDWSVNAATLAQYYASNDNFELAKHHIEAAYYVFGSSEMTKPDDDERHRKAKADLSRIVVKLCIFLFESNDSNHQHSAELPLLDLKSTNVALPTSAIPVTSPSSFEDARILFLIATRALEGAKSYYTLDEHASDNVDCVRDNSKLYQLLAKFEPDNERKCKMHKRRIDLLDNLLKELNFNYFLSQCRQILFEIGETYSEMVDLKLGLIAGKKKQDEIKSSALKINQLAAKGISNFERFIESFADRKTNQLPETFSDDMVKPILTAYFSIGRLYTKILVTDQNEQMKNWKCCEAQYNKVTGYVDRNPEHESLVSEELRLVREMLALIPGKLNLFLNSRMY